MGKLDDKVAIITGAASGMGKSHAQRFVEEGAKVVIADIADEGQNLADELGDNATFVEHNVTNEDDWDNLVKTVEDHFGAIDILVNNAGISGPPTNLVDYDSDDYLNIMNINLNGYFYGIKAVFPSIKKQEGGSIINIASAAGVRHVEESQNFAYTTSKHGVIGLTKAAAIELANHDIRVNAVNPGVIETPMMEDYKNEVNINQIGVFLGMKTVYPSMKKSDEGSIINISSAATLRGTPNTVAYTATKYAIAGMTKVAAIEFGPDNIRANSIHPGPITTGMFNIETQEEQAKELPLSRVGKEEEITNMIVFLASDEGTYATGAEFVVDGGMTV